MKLASALLSIFLLATPVVASQVIFEQSETANGLTTTFRQLDSGTCSYSIQFDSTTIIVAGSMYNSDLIYSVYQGDQFEQSSTFNRRHPQLVRSHWDFIQIGRRVINQLCK